MRAWSTERVARAAGAHVARAARGDGGPAGATVDSRAIRPGDLFAGLRGERADGADFAGEALAAGAWGALVGPEHEALGGAGAVLVADDPLIALQRLATAWRRELGAAGARVIGVTGSTGKTSTKDILAAMLAPHRRTWASPANLNTEIGLPLALLAAPEGTQALVLELAMRGAGQIAELTAISEPDVGVIVNVGPVHLERLGSLEAIAAAKAELLRDMRPGGTAVVPAGEPLLDAHRPAHLALVTFGEGGDVSLVEARGDRLAIDAAGVTVELEVSFAQPHQRTNALAGVAAARALGVTPSGRVDVSFSAWRGERIDFPGDIVVINDCYNANPMSMRAALDDLAASAAGRRVAVLGDMLELGADEAAFHHEAGRQAARAGVEVLVAVGRLGEAVAEGYETSSADEDGAALPERRRTHVEPDAQRAAHLVRELVAPGDTVLVKASRGVGLERVAQGLADHAVEAS